MARLRTRCTYYPCRVRGSIPDTPRNRARLEDRVIECKACGIGKIRFEDRSRELKKRKEDGDLCYDDCMPWSMKNGPHSKRTPGCKHYEEWKMESVIAGRSQSSDDPDQEPIW